MNIDRRSINFHNQTERPIIDLDEIATRRVMGDGCKVAFDVDDNLASSLRGVHRIISEVQD